MSTLRGLWDILTWLWTHSTIGYLLCFGIGTMFLVQSVLTLDDCEFYLAIGFIIAAGIFWVHGFIDAIRYGGP